MQVATTLHELGVCVGEAGHHKRAVHHLTRVLHIRASQLGPDCLEMVSTRGELDRFVAEAEADKRAGGRLWNVLAAMCRPNTVCY